MKPEDLSPEQVSTLKSWAAEGLDLGDIQKKLGNDLEIKLTYLDTRFLLGDLGIELAEDEPEEEEEPEAPAEPAPGEAPDPAHAGEATASPDAGAPAAGEATAGTNPFAKKPEDGGEATPAPGGNVTVTVDQVAVPGTMVSGRVVFSDGKGSGWYIDQAGSLGLNPDDAEHRPSEPDVLAFQKELEAALRKAGLG